MPKIFLVGKGTLKKEYQRALIARGHKIKRYESLGSALQKLNEKPDLFIIDKKQGTEPAFREFLKLSRDIPKIVISDSHRGFTNWLKEPFTYSLFLPSTRELLYSVKRVLKEKEILLESKKIKSDISVASRKLNFYEEVAKTLTSSSDLDNVLGTVMRRISDITKAEAWTIFLVDEESGELVFERANGRKKKEKNRFRQKIGEGIIGWVAKEEIPVLSPDVSQDKRFSVKIDRAIYSDRKIKSVMCVPIKSRGKLLGVLEVLNKTTGDPFTKEDLVQLMKLMGQATIAVDRMLLYHKMKELSITDDLTKLFNTSYLDRTIEMEIERSNRYRTSVSLIFMDIDYFKQINDHYGHLVGSKVLVATGQFLLKSLRSVDVIARYGGDEFVIVLPHTSPYAAAQVAERIRKAIERNVFLRKEGYSLKLTASFGVASYPEAAKSKEELIRLADEAMYKVKYQSRNGVYVII